MNQKYHEFAGKFLPVVAVSGIVALLIRLKLMDGKPDAFFFNIIFILMLVLFITMYSHIILLGEELIKFITRLFRNKNIEVSQIQEDENLILEENKQFLEDVQNLEDDSKTSPNDNQILNKDISILKDDKNKFQDDKPILKTENHISDTLQCDDEKLINFSDIEKIRILAKAREEEIIQEKLELIVQYAKEKLALYTTDEDFIIGETKSKKNIDYERQLMTGRNT